MRTYYRHAANGISPGKSSRRRSATSAALVLQAISPQAHARCGTDFFLENNRLYLDEAASVHDADSMLRIFGLMPNNRLQIKPERRKTASQTRFPCFAVQMPEGPFCGTACSEVLLGPFCSPCSAHHARIGHLELLIPEFHGIDSLVIRDSYHRYTSTSTPSSVIDNVTSCVNAHHDGKAHERPASRTRRLNCFSSAC